MRGYETYLVISIGGAPFPEQQEQTFQDVAGGQQEVTQPPKPDHLAGQRIVEGNAFLNRD
jgi:hypothetical protein